MGIMYLTEEEVDKFFSGYRAQLLELRQKSRSKNKNRPDDEFEWYLSYSASFPAVAMTVQLTQRDKQGYATVVIGYRWKLGSHAHWSIRLPGPNGSLMGGPDLNSNEYWRGQYGANNEKCAIHDYLEHRGIANHFNIEIY